MAPPTAPPESGPASRLGKAFARLLPLLAVGVLMLTLGATLAAAGDTLGYDFRSYYTAASRVLAGQPLYDASAADTGLTGGFKYPPAFVLPLLPLALLPWGVAAWVWTALTLAAFATGTALLPIRPLVRWSVVLLAGLSFPFVYATKLGQVGSILYLLFAVGWRWLDRPGVLGTTAALGALVKVQPGLVLVWAVLTRRWRAVLIGGAVIAVAVLVAALVLRPSVWTDYLALPGRVSDPITTPHNLSLGALAYDAGLSRELASAIQWMSTLAAGAALVIAALRLPAAPSYLVAVVVSQLVSPITWDHYAMLLLLPVAWLLDRGRWWALLIPLLTSLLLVELVPPIVYPISFWATLVALLAVGARPVRTVATG